MRKLSLFLLTGILTAALLSGCSQKKQETTTQQSVSTEAETTQETTTAAPKEESLSARWFQTAYAILTEANQTDITLVGGFEKNEENTLLVRDLLNSYWGVTDRASAKETLIWLVEVGHRSSFQDEMAAFKSMGMQDMSAQEVTTQLRDMDLTDQQAACYLAMIEAHKTLGDEAIDAWDYCRALQLLGWYYVADYYTLDETLDQSLEVAKTMQGLFTSWDQMAESYLLGYNYWAEDDPTDPNSNTAQRRAVYQGLKEQPDNPYLLDWNTKLEKSW